MDQGRGPGEELDLDAVDIRRGDGTRVSRGDVARMMAEARESVRDMTDEDAPAAGRGRHQGAGR